MHIIEIIYITVTIILIICFFIGEITFHLQHKALLRELDEHMTWFEKNGGDKNDH